MSESKQAGAVLIFALLMLLLSSLSVNALLQQALTSEKRTQMNRFWLQADERLDNEVLLQLAAINRDAQAIWDQLHPSMATAPQHRLIERASAQDPEHATLSIRLTAAQNGCIVPGAPIRDPYLCLDLTIAYISDQTLYRNQAFMSVPVVLIRSTSTPNQGQHRNARHDYALRILNAD